MPEPLTREQIIAALAALPTKDAQSIISEARARDRQQRMEAGAAAIRAYLHPTRTSEPDETEE